MTRSISKFAMPGKVLLFIVRKASYRGCTGLGENVPCPQLENFRANLGGFSSVGAEIIAAAMSTKCGSLMAEGH